MSFRLALLLDTHLLVPLQDAYAALEDDLTALLQLAKDHEHTLCYHPATVREFQRDSNLLRLQRNMLRLAHYTPLAVSEPCPWNNKETPEGTACDNDMLYALASNIANLLVTEDPHMHALARELGLQHRVHTIQMAKHWLQMLHEPLALRAAHVEDLPLRNLLPALATPFFDSLRAAYRSTTRPWHFDDWMQEQADAGCHAWCCKDRQGTLQAICIYAEQALPAPKVGKRLQLSCFKVNLAARSRHIGELFVAAAFRHAAQNACEEISIHIAATELHLLRWLQDMGFEVRGTQGNERLLIKQQPLAAPAIDGSPLAYARRYFPHFRADTDIQSFLVPIPPDQHQALFADYVPQQGQLFAPTEPALCTIRHAYVCRSDIKDVQAGDLLLFYRNKDEKALTSVGIVEHFQITQDAAELASLISRRANYSSAQITAITSKPVKVFLFRTVEHFPRAVRLDQLQKICEIAGPLTTIRRLQHEQLQKILAAGRT